jgi:hypothetical protein
MPDYAWVCHSCGVTNPAGFEACDACGCGAVASAADLEESRCGAVRPPRLTRKEWHAQRRAEIAALPLWKKPAAYALQAVRVVAAICVLFGIFDLSLRAGLVGFGLVIVAEIMFSLLKGPPYGWRDG